MKAKGMHEVHGTLERGKESAKRIKGGQKFCTRKYVQKSTEYTKNVHTRCASRVRKVKKD